MRGRQRSLLDLVDVIGGGTPSRSQDRFWGGNIPWATVKDLVHTSIAHTVEHITQAGLDNCASKLVPAGAVVLATRIAPGRAALVTSEIAINQDLKGLLPRDGIDSRYLFQFIRSIAPELNRMSSGSTVKGITLESLARVRVTVPSLSEQKRIAASLEKADVILQNRRHGLRLLDDFLPSSFVQLFGDPVTNEKGWKLSRIGDHLSFLTSGSRGWARYYATSGRPFLRIQNVGRNSLKLNDLAFVTPPPGAETNRTTVRTGDILLSITADLGRTAVVTPVLAGAHINQHLALLRVRDIDPLFVSQFLASEGGRRQFLHLNRQAVKAGLNFDDIRSLQIPVPPKEQQLLFVALYKCWEATHNHFQYAVQTAYRFSNALAYELLSRHRAA